MLSEASIIPDEFLPELVEAENSNPEQSPNTIEEAYNNVESLDTGQIREINQELPMQIYESYGDEITAEVLGGSGGLETLTNEHGVVFVPETGSIIIPENSTATSAESDTYVAYDEDEFKDEGMMIAKTQKDSVLDLEGIDPRNISEEDQKKINQAKGLIMGGLARGNVSMNVRTEAWAEADRQRGEYPIDRKRDIIIEEGKAVQTQEAISAFTLPNGKRVVGEYDDAGKFYLSSQGEKYDLTNEDVLFLSNKFFKGGPQSGETPLGLQSLETDAQRRPQIEFEAEAIGLDQEDELLEQMQDMVPSHVTAFQHFFLSEDGEKNAYTAAELFTRNRKDSGELPIPEVVPYVGEDGKLGARGVGKEFRFKPEVISEGLIIFKDQSADDSERLIVRKTEKGDWRVESSTIE